MRRAGVLRRAGWALSGGLSGGSAVGLAETVWVVASTAPSEYQALVYGAVLYGLVGGLLGLGMGGALVLLPARVAPGPGRAWCLGFFGVVGVLGVPITSYLLDRAVYAEQGVPSGTFAAVVAVFVLVAAVGVWIGTNVLTKTPLKVLPERKATGVAWGGLVALCFLFSAAPPPGERRLMVPDHDQTDTLRAKPDVYLILVDTLRADALGVYGAPPGATPRLDAFAADAVTFDQAVAAASWTRPATASLLTASFPSQHGCRTKEAMLPDGLDTLPEVLQRNGYATGGLPNNPNVTGTFGFDQGFDWYPYHPEYPLGAAESTYALSLYSLLRTTWARVNPEKRVENWYRPAEAQVERALEWIEAQGGDRAFLFLHLMEPHDPYFTHPYDGEAVGRAELPTPAPGQAAHLRALYAGEVHHLDAELGRFFDRLAAAGRYDDALIVVTSDHGEELYDHGGWWHGTTLYDEQIHVPLLVKLPGNRRGGTRVPWQVRTIDIAPTIADLVSVDVGTGWVGESVFVDDFDEQLALLRPPVPPVLEGSAPGGAEAPVEAGEEAEEPFVPPTWADHPASRAAIAEQDFEGYVLQALRVDGLKLVEVLRAPSPDPRGLPPVACFDLLADPEEAHNLAGTGASCEAALAQRLHDLTGRDPLGGAPP